MTVPDALLNILSALEAAEVDCIIVGGLAALHHGAPIRSTQREGALAARAEVLLARAGQLGASTIVPAGAHAKSWDFGQRSPLDVVERVSVFVIVLADRDGAPP